AWSLLRGLLLGADGAPVCWRHHECALDRGSRDCRTPGEARPARPVVCARHRYHSPWLGRGDARCLRPTPFQRSSPTKPWNNCAFRETECPWFHPISYGLARIGVVRSAAGDRPPDLSTTHHIGHTILPL